MGVIYECTFGAARQTGNSTFVGHFDNQSISYPPPASVLGDGNLRGLVEMRTRTALFLDSSELQNNFSWFSPVSMSPFV